MYACLDRHLYVREVTRSVRVHSHAGRVRTQRNLCDLRDVKCREIALTWRDESSLVDSTDLKSGGERTMNALVTTPADVGKGICLRSDGLASQLSVKRSHWE